VSEDVFDRALDRRDAVIEEQRRRIKALEEALTPSAGTKYAFLGEFRQARGSRKVTIEWTTIKESMQAIRDHADALLKEAER
jgi:hypothetical protein